MPIGLISGILGGGHFSGGSHAIQSNDPASYTGGSIGSGATAPSNFNVNQFNQALNNVHHTGSNQSASFSQSAHGFHGISGGQFGGQSGGVQNPGGLLDAKIDGKLSGGLSLVGDLLGGHNSHGSGNGGILGGLLGGITGGGVAGGHGGGISGGALGGGGLGSVAGAPLGLFSNLVGHDSAANAASNGDVQGWLVNTFDHSGHSHPLGGNSGGGSGAPLGILGTLGQEAGGLIGLDTVFGSAQAYDANNGTNFASCGSSNYGLTGGIGLGGLLGGGGVNGASAHSTHSKH